MITKYRNISSYTPTTPYIWNCNINQLCLRLPWDETILNIADSGNVKKAYCALFLPIYYNHIRNVLIHSTVFLSRSISCRSLIIQGSLFYCAISQCTFLENTRLIARWGQEFHPGEMTVSDELICDTNVSIQVVFKELSLSHAKLWRVSVLWTLQVQVNKHKQRLFTTWKIISWEPFDGVLPTTKQHFVLNSPTEWLNLQGR